MKQYVELAISTGNLSQIDGFNATELSYVYKMPTRSYCTIPINPLNVFNGS